ncbi:hypothetical protein [Neisseria sp. Ec49-e6-T10]|uniref:hypothetical protein n=1 Tax=Neisseria sp. Ec49-e6-T10 TaxID=3140744 RepID=UPI003EB87514
MKLDKFGQNMWNFLRKKQKNTKVENGFKPEEAIYSASFEDLSPGYEDVYEPYLTITINHHDYEELVLLRFIDGTIGQQLLSEAINDVLTFVQEQKKQNIPVSYKRLPINYLSDAERDQINFLEIKIQSILKSHL